MRYCMMTEEMNDKKVDPICCRMWKKFFGINADDAVTLREGEQELVSNIIALHDKEVEDCMVPRAQIMSVDTTELPQALLDQMTEQGHSRIPVYRETLDDTIGFVHIKDLVIRLSKKETFTLRDVLRPIMFVAPSMPVVKLILQMRQKRQHMAMVIDEFGGVDGLVTIEDLIEEIVGDIEDEHDAPVTSPIITRADGTLLIDASLPIEEFEARAGNVLGPEERETIETLAGYVFHVAGHIPDVGETVDGLRGLKFDILDSDSTLIKRVRVSGVKK